MDSGKETDKEEKRRVPMEFCRPTSIIAYLLVILIRISTVCYVIFSFVLRYYEEIFSPDIVAVADDINVLGLPVGTSVTTVSFVQASFLFIQAVMGIFVIFGFILRRRSFLFVFEVTNILLLVIDVICLSFFSAIRSHVTYITDEMRILFFNFVTTYQSTGVIGGKVEEGWLLMFDKLECFGPAVSVTNPVVVLSYPYGINCYDYCGRKLAAYTEVFLVIGVFSISLEIISIMFTEREYRIINKETIWLGMSEDSLWRFRLGMLADIQRAMKRNCLKNTNAPLQKKALLFFSFILMTMDFAFMVGVIWMAFDPAVMEYNLTSQLTSIPYVSGMDSSFTDILRGMAYGFIVFTALHILHIFFGIFVVYMLTKNRKCNIMYSAGAFIFTIFSVGLCGLSYHFVNLANCCNLAPTSCSLAPEDTISQICSTNKYNLRWIAWGSLAYCIASVLLNIICGLVPLTYTCNNKTHPKMLSKDGSGNTDEHTLADLETNRKTLTKSDSVKSDLSQLEELLGLK